MMQTLWTWHLYIYWHRLPSEVMEFWSLEVFQNSADVALRMWTVGMVGVGWVGLRELYSSLNDCMILTLIYVLN